MTRLKAILLGALLCACSSSAADAPTAPDSSPAVLAACTWPSDLDPTNAGAGRCTAKRHRLKCDSGDAGVFAECLSNQADQCEGSSSSFPGVTFSCHDECGPQEYGVVCGRVGPSGVSAEPPSPNCRAPASTPAGVAFYCCPCGS